MFSSFFCLNFNKKIIICIILNRNDYLCNQIYVNTQPSLELLLRCGIETKNTRYYDYN